jgi:hypothetical protein
MTEETKSIDTLIDDIYSVFTDGYSKSPDNEKLIDAFGEAMKDLMKSRLPPRESSGGTLRLSAIGKPARQLWYDSRGVEKPDFTGDQLLKFFYGDVIEEVLLTLAKLSGHSVTNEQQEVVVAGITGHMDAVIDGHVIDVKSASAAAFKKFDKGSLVFDDPFGYMNQIAAYSEAVEGNKGSGFLAMNKVDGKLTLFQPDPDFLPDTQERVDYLKEALASDTPPERCYEEVTETNGNKKLPMGCAFCPFKKECWKDANNGTGLRGFGYSFGTVYLTHVEKAPRVGEVEVE